MAKRSVVWTVTAAKQRRSILNYWLQVTGNKDYSRKIIETTKKHVQLILKYPKSGREMEIPGVRASVMGYFSLIYTLSTREINIIAFWDNRQNPKTLFDQLKNKG
jgi:plasmid stabilization system protein ParE